MAKAGYIVLAGDEIIALSDNRDMVTAYNDFKGGIFKIKMIEYKAFKHLRGVMENRLLVETDFKTPLTSEELTYVTHTMGDIEHIVCNMMSEIKAIVDIVNEDDARKLVKFSKILRGYSTPKKAFRNTEIEDTLREYTFADTKLTNMIQQTNILNGKMGEI